MGGEENKKEEASEGGVVGGRAACKFLSCSHPVVGVSANPLMSWSPSPNCESPGVFASVCRPKSVSVCQFERCVSGRPQQGIPVMLGVFVCLKRHLPSGGGSF